MAIMAANSQSNRNSGNPYMTSGFDSDNERKIGHFDCTSIMDTLNEIDDRNIRVMFKQAKDPVELAFAHIDSQPLKKIATNAIKESVLDIQEGFEDLKDSMSDIKDSFGDFFSFLGKFFTSNEEFIPEQI